MLCGSCAPFRPGDRLYVRPLVLQPIPVLLLDSADQSDLFIDDEETFCLDLFDYDSFDWRRAV